MSPLKISWMGCCLVTALAVQSALADWPQASGPNDDFVINGKGPSAFSVAKKQGVRWTAALPSTGQGTPIVSKGRVFVTSHEPITEDSELGDDIIGMCFDATTGKELWRRVIPGVRNTDLSSLFSDNTAASPVADGERVCFVNVGGGIRVFDYEGNEQWSYDWVPFGRHHARLHEPILHDGAVITMQYPHQDLEFEHTTKPGAAKLGRGEHYWTRLQAFDLRSGKRKWISSTGTSVHQTSIKGVLPDGTFAILTGRGGGHKPPEEPFGMSLVNAADGKAIWDLPIGNYPSAQNACWDGKHAYAFAGTEHLKIDVVKGTILSRTSVIEGVDVTKRVDDKLVKESGVNLRKVKRTITKNANVLADGYHYFRSDSGFLIGRVHLESEKVEYLQVPVQVVRKKGQKDELLWDKALPNDMKTSNGFVATGDKRNAGNGWGHVSAASPIVVGNRVYMPTMVGMVYVIKADAPVLDQKALLSVSDLGPATETWSLSSLAFSGGKIYARTLKELICIGEE